MEQTIRDVRVGDLVVCFDSFGSHDYCEHIMKVESIEEDDENGVALYGRDTEEEEWGDDYISRVDESNFVRIYREA